MTDNWQNPTTFEVTLPDGAVLRGQRAGTGPKVLLIHGWCMNRSNWQRTGQGLFDAGYEVIAYDARGHGSSDRGTQSLQVEQLRDDLGCVLDSLNIDSTLLVGHSLGGMTIMAFAATGDKRVRGLVIVGSSASPVYPRLLVPGAHLLSLLMHPRLTKKSSARTSNKKGVKKRTPNIRFALGKNPPDWARETTARCIMSTNPTVVYDQFKALIRLNISMQLQHIQVPVTILGGNRDLVTPPWHSKRIHKKIPGSKLIMLGGAGHMVMLERGEETLTEIKALLEKVSPANTGNAA